MNHLTHAGIAHRWATRNAPSEKELRAYAVFCDPDTIWSYCYHFPIAVFWDERTVLFNADKYSKSTAKHQRIVRHALQSHRKDVTVFELPRAAWTSHDLSIQFYQDKIQSTVNKWKRARSYKTIHMRDAHHYLQEFKTFCAFHKINLSKILRRDGTLAAAAAVIALNPVADTEY
jgi:hypothetical protein